jgi:4-aminobutyrate aminotransferase-like enzyme/Ser/Thr protein kinase RdoA (MazF antagonist)
MNGPANGGEAWLAPLLTPAPNLDPEVAAIIAAERFGIRGTISGLGGERDQNLRIDTVDGGAVVLKVSNPADDVRVLDLHHAALRHLERHDPSLPVMREIPTVDGAPWTTVEHDGRTYHTRVFTLVPGEVRDAATLDLDAIRAHGTFVARVTRALQGFFHPAARYEILWDLRHTLRLRDLVPHVADADRRALAERVLDRFERTVTPRFDALRAQVVHNDLTLDNVLLGADLRASGVVDLGDLTHTAVVADLAIALAGLIWRQPDPLAAAEAAVAGYVRLGTLDDEEAGLLGDLAAARLVAWGVIAAWRVQHHPDNAAYITAGEDDAWAVLDHLEMLGNEVVSRRFRTAARAGHLPYRSLPTPALAARRPQVLGRSPLSYDRPLHLVAGDGVWLTAADGRRYLDAYNNVPVVGHAHPSVAAAIAGQAHLLATNTRYLHEAAVALGERLTATFPPELDTVVLVNSGSEANDLAWRLARAVTGRTGAVTTANAYHGITAATTDLSPEVWPTGDPPSHVRTVPAPLDDPTAGGFPASVAAALTDLAGRGHAPAAVIIDPACTSDGVTAPHPDALRGLADATRAAGALLIVDEVQAGHGRLGEHLWSHHPSGITSDVVTLGKPMGNGHPVAAVVTRAELAETLMATSEVFSTFGGNPVSCVAALAVLDVIEDDGLVARAAAVGRRLQASLADLAAASPHLGAVRGAGLLLGVEVVGDPDVPDAIGAATARAIVEGLRARGVLIGVTGPDGDVLKIRPPLVFDDTHVDHLLAALEETLHALDRAPMYQREGQPNERDSDE